MKPSSARQRRASVYGAVLVSTSFVVTVGLTAVAAVRLTGRTLEDAGDAQAARLLTQAGMDYALQKIASTATWRADVAGGGWTAPVPFGAGRFQMVITDPSDGDLTDDPLDPIDIEIRAGARSSRHLNHARITFAYVDSPLNNALMTGGNLTMTDAVIATDAPLYAGGAVSAATSNIDAEVYASGAISGSGYKRGTHAGAASPTMPNASSVFSTYSARATNIAWADLPVDGTNLLSNSGFELNALGSYTGYGAATIQRINIDPHSGGYALEVKDRAVPADGVAGDVSGVLKNDTQYTARVWVRPDSAPANVILAIKAEVTNNSGPLATAKELDTAKVTSTGGLGGFDASTAGAAMASNFPIWS